MLDYQRIVRAAEALDPVPVTVSRLVAIVAHDHWAFSDVEQLISLDQALTGRLLQIANSAWSASLMPIGTVKDAVIRIGIGPTVTFAVGACVGPSMRRALPEYGLSEGELWRHSVAASLAAEILSAMSPVDVPAEAVTAALLHDVGKLVLARFLTPELLRGLADARAAGDRSMMQAEAEVLGVHHGELGGLIARHWNLPDRVAEAITHHHSPDRVGDVVCDAVALANVAAKLVERRPDTLDVDLEPSAGAVSRLQLAPNFLDRLCSHIARRLEELLARYEPAAEPPAVVRTPRAVASAGSVRT
jgi:putative nucleotidyltransferase with HDIG domain